MLSRKGCIPKYLHKRKIELLREKIIKRKYGYLFYRKTLSDILPSEARKHYTCRLKKTYFLNWYTFWYKERIEWKLLLKADIHYHLNLQFKCFKRWKCYLLHRKAMLLKTEIAIIHFQYNEKHQIMRDYLYKWKLFLKIQKENRLKNKLAYVFFKSKFQSECLRSYFERWIKLTKTIKKNKIEIAKTRVLYETNLKHKVLKKLLLYVNNRKIKINKYRELRRFYEKRLMIKVLKLWLKFTQIMIDNKVNILLSEAHYSNKLKRKYFSLFRKHLQRQYYVHNKLEEYQRYQKKKVFGSLRAFIIRQRMKKNKNETAINFYRKSLQSLIFKNLKKYKTHRQVKKVLNARMNDIITRHVDNLRKRRFFKKWIEYIVYDKQRKHLELQCEKRYHIKITRRTFTFWIYFVSHKKDKKRRIERAVDTYLVNLKQSALKQWRNYATEEKKYKEKVMSARQFYINNLIHEGLQLIALTGLREKEKCFKSSLSKFSNQLFLAQKYFSIWKERTIFKFKKPSTAKDDTMAVVSNVNWCQMYFLCPSLPQGTISGSDSTMNLKICS